MSSSISSTSMTAAAGCVTAIVGGLAKRSTWTPRYAPKASTTTVSSAKTTMLGEKVSPWRAPRSGCGTTIAGGCSLASPRSVATGGGRRRGRVRGTARSCAGSPWCRPRPAAPCSRRAPARRGSARGSSCRARRGRGRRPCAHGRHRGAPAGSAPGSTVTPRPASDRSTPTARLSCSRVVIRLPRRGRRPARPIRRLVAAEDLPGVRSVERPDIAACLELIDHPGRPRIPDLEAALEERR